MIREVVAVPFWQTVATIEPVISDFVKIAAKEV